MPGLSLENHALPIGRQITCESEVFPKPSHLRRLLAIGGLWVSTSTGRRALVLIQGAKLLLQIRGGVMVELVYEAGHFLEIAETSIERFARALDLIGSRGALLTDACTRAITLMAREGRMPLRVGIATDYSCIALVAPAEAMRSLRASRLDASAMPDSFRRPPSSSLGRGWEEIRRELESFTQGLDEESVSLCRNLGTPSAQLYSYLQGGGSAATRRSRHEAVAMFPFLARYIAASDKTPAALLRMGIDLGESPIDAMASTFEISRDIVRVVARRSAPDLGIEYDENERLSRDKDGPWDGEFANFVPSQMFWSLGLVPARQRPADRTQWRVFQEAAYRMGKDTFASAWWGWAEDFGRNVLQSLARMGWPATIAIGTDDVDIDFALDDLMDFLGPMSDALCAIADIDAITPSPNSVCNAEIAEFASRTGLRNLISMSRRWHELYSGAIRATARSQHDESGARAAVVLLQKPVQVGALTIVQLLTQSEFLHEGMEMGHCVASQVDYALAGRAAFFSVRTEAGQRVSTFDLSIRRIDGTFKLILNSHRGPHNRNPNREAIDAAKVFCRQLLEEPLKDTLTCYAERIDLTRLMQDGRHRVDLETPARKAEQEARSMAANQVLRRYLPKMVNNVRRRCERERGI